MLGETAYEELRGHDELPTVEVAACLLRICRTRAHELDRVLQRRHEAGAPYGPYLAAAEAIIVDHRDSLDPEFLHRRELEQIVSLLAAAADLEDLALRARDIATVLIPWWCSRCFLPIRARRLDDGKRAVARKPVREHDRELDAVVRSLLVVRPRRPAQLSHSR